MKPDTRNYGKNHPRFRASFQAGGAVAPLAQPPGTAPSGTAPSGMAPSGAAPPDPASSIYNPSGTQLGARSAKPIPMGSTWNSEKRRLFASFWQAWWLIGFWQNC